MYLLGQRYGRIVFSHDTALYLLGYSDRMPIRFTVTLPQGYNTPSFARDDLIVHRTVKENYNLGLSEAKTIFGNTVRCYDLERTLCDVLRGDGIDIQIVNPAMRKYACSKELNVMKIMAYARQLKVEKKVSRYLEVLL